MRINFNHMLFFVVASFQPKFLTNKTPSPEDLVFAFEEYVKSQVHLNMLFSKERVLSRYESAYRFLEHHEGDDREVDAVLGWFYHDMSNLFLNSYLDKYMMEQKFDVVFDDKWELMRPISFSIEAERRELQTLLDGTSTASKYLEVFNLGLKNIASLQLCDRVVQAFVLKYMAKHHGRRKVLFMQ